MWDLHINKDEYKIDYLRTHYIGYEDCSPSHSWGPFARDHYLVHFVKQGSGTYQIGQKSFKLHENQAFLAPPYQSIYYEASRTDPWHYAWVGFSGKEARKIVRQLGFNDNLIASNLPCLDIYNIIRSHQNSSQNVSFTNEYKLLSIFFSVLSLFEDSNKYSSTSQELAQTNIHMQKALTYIHTNYMKNLSVDSLASYLMISRKYLFRLFKDHLGISPQSYIIDYRLEKAIDFMNHPSLNIAQISRSVGYEDQLHFSKMFKLKYKKSPRDYRKTHILT